MEANPTSLQQNKILTDLAQTANEKLETAGQNGANHAFNLGCSMGLAPVAILVILAFILSKANWVLTAIVFTISGMFLLIFANLVAYLARSSNIARTYQRDVNPEIERTLKKMDLTRPEFDEQAGLVLPNDAILRNYIIIPLEKTTSDEEDL